jgi:dihydrolipoamide dehydrogenase
MSDFDLVVIGGGPAGFAAAVRAWDFGRRVAIVEKGRLGGAGLHHGALSSKTLWELSRDYRNALKRDRGFDAGRVDVDFGRVLRCAEQTVEIRMDQMRRQLTALSQPRPGRPGSITLLPGTARLLDAHRVLVEGQAQDRAVSADNILLATGSRPRALDTVPVDGIHVLTSDHVSSLERFPRSLVVIGAGVVGCEFATIFANYGQTKVYLIDKAERILPFEDEDVSRHCSRNLEDKGVTIHHRTKLVDLRVVEGEVEYTIEHHTGGRETIRVEKALVSIGRDPNSRGLGLEEAGVKLAPSGHVAVEDTRTSVPTIFATGDLTPGISLVSVAEAEARHAVERMFGGVREPLSEEHTSWIYFLDPEVAAIGINELQAQQKRIPYRVAAYGYRLVSRALAMRAAGGYVKILVTDDDQMRILGMRALGVHASTTIEAVSLMMLRGSSVREIAEIPHPHPAVTEGLQDCVRMLLGTSIWKPQVFESDLRLSRIRYADDGAAVEASVRLPPSGAPLKVEPASDPGAG